MGLSRSSPINDRHRRRAERLRRQHRSGAFTATTPGADDGEAHREERHDAPTQQCDQAEQDQADRRIEQRRQAGEPRHRRLQPRQPLHRPAKLRQLIHTSRQVGHRRQLGLQIRHAIERGLQSATQPRGSVACPPAGPSTAPARPLPRVPAGSPPAATWASATRRARASRDRGSRRDPSARATRTRLSSVGSSAATAFIGSRSRSTPWSAGTSATVDALDCLMVSLLARIAAVLALMFSLFSRKVIASEQPLHTNVASEIWMSRSRDVMVLCSVSDPCSAILRVLECITRAQRAQP